MSSQASCKYLLSNTHMHKHEHTHEHAHRDTNRDTDTDTNTNKNAPFLHWWRLMLFGTRPLNQQSEFSSNAHGHIYSIFIFKIDANLFQYRIHTHPDYIFKSMIVPWYSPNLPWNSASFVTLWDTYSSKPYLSLKSGWKYGESKKLVNDICVQINL